MTSENSQNRASWDVAFGQEPRKGSRSIQQILDFTLENPVNINLTYEEQSLRLEFVQTIYVDNSNNPNALVCTMRTTNQIITVPGGWQAYIPVLASKSNCKMSFSTVAGSAANSPKVPIFFLSFPAPLDLWPVSVGSSGTDYSANKPALAANLLAIIPVNPARALIEIQNQSADTIQILRDDGSGGNVTFLLLSPGAGANMQGSSWSSSTFKGRILVYGPNGNDQVAIYED